MYPDLWSVKSSLEKQEVACGGFQHKKAILALITHQIRAVFHILQEFPCFPNRSWKSSGQRGVLLIAAKILGRNLEIKLAVTYWSSECIDACIDGSNVGLRRIYRNFWGFTSARTSRTVQTNVPYFP